MEIVTIFIKIFDILTALPLKILFWPIKLIYPLKKVINEIYIRLPESPLTFSINVSNSPPRAEIYLEVINASLIDIFIEKFCIEFLLSKGITLLRNCCFFNRGVIKRGNTNFFSQTIDLNEFQVKKLQEFKNELDQRYKFATANVILNLKTKFHGKFQKKIRIVEIVYNIT